MIKKVVFIGGLSNGKIVYDYLIRNKHIDLCLTITYPDNCDKPRFVKFPNGQNIIKTYSANKELNKIKELKPDLIIVAGWSELLLKELITTPQYNTIGFHPAKLPMDRGRSVLAWQIEDGYKETALTMFFYNDIPDGGNIIAQEKISISSSDYIEDILNKIDEATYNIMYAYFPLLRQIKIKGIIQDNSTASFRRLRKEKDDLINWNKSSIEIYNKIRAISKPYPGAVFYDMNNDKCKIWKAKIINNFEFGNYTKPGTIIAIFYNNYMLIKTKDSFILVKEWEKIQKN